MDHQPTILPRAEHSISRKDISENALKVLYRLHKAGYAAYLVGGGVRDLLLGGHPKDFDVATDATPEQVKALFGNCRLIGRRFRLAHVHFGRDIIEVATFRGHHGQAETENDGLIRNGMILRDNVFGTLEEDAVRRDFRVNALYYNIADFSIVDYTGGLEDIQTRRLHMIGDPHTRICEDPVRMLRAIRFAAKLGFRIDNTIEEQFAELGERLAEIPSARLFDEVLKLFLSGHALKTYQLLKEHGLLKYLFPETVHWLEKDEVFDAFICQGLQNTDLRIQQDKPVTPFFLFAVLLWWPVKKRADELQHDGMTELQALQVASDDVISDEVKSVAIPRRFSIAAKEIWTMQARLPRRKGKRAYRLLEHKRFRAAYDFLVLRDSVDKDEETHSIAEWWTRFQDVSNAERKKMIMALNKNPPSRGKKKPRKQRNDSTNEVIN